MKTICYILLLILITQKIFAQKDQETWDSYMATFENKPGSTVVRMDLIDSAPLKEYKFILITGVTYESKSPDGLPDNNTLSFVQQIGDELQQLMHSTLKEVYVGSCMYNYERLEYFYLKDTLGIRNVLKEFYLSKYPKFKKYINLREDFDWKGYREFLYPSETIINYMADSKVVKSLVDNGDNLTKSRKVEHFAYFKSQNESEEFKVEIEKKGYLIIEIGKNSIGEYPHKVLFWKDQFVDLESINQVTKSLKDIAKKYKGEYDGWETVVIKE